MTKDQRSALANLNGWLMITVLVAIAAVAVKTTRAETPQAEKAFAEANRLLNEIT